MSNSYHEKNKEAEELSNELGIKVIWDDSNGVWVACTPKGINVPSLKNKNGVRAVAGLVGRIKALEGENIELRSEIARLKEASTSDTEGQDNR